MSEVSKEDRVAIHPDLQDRYRQMKLMLGLFPLFLLMVFFMDQSRDTVSLYSLMIKILHVMPMALCGSGLIWSGFYYYQRISWIVQNCQPRETMATLKRGLTSPYAATFGNVDSPVKSEAQRVLLAPLNPNQRALFTGQQSLLKVYSDPITNKPVAVLTPNGLIPRASMFFSPRLLLPSGDNMSVNWGLVLLILGGITFMPMFTGHL